MKSRAAIFMAVAGAAFFLRAADSRVPGLPPSVKDARADAGFLSEQYFDEPNQQQVKLRFSGASVAPLPGGLQEVRGVRIEMFNPNGLTRAVAEAPQCELSVFDGVASSAGRLVMASGDGKFHIEGDGFLWRQNISSNELTLVISNHVHSVLKMGTNSFIKL
jgi:hypothetical protein